ncbi:hypothetical protein DNTS_033460, partial [Danionella cerebrum]
QVQVICEKGLSVGHSRVNILGNPGKGVYLSKFSDLLQMNPFEVGAVGEIIIFKVMKGKVKTIFENMPKNSFEPTPKYDSHVYKNASKVTSLLSYRAFEHTQQYFYEFAFDELKSRPRHVLPYAVLSFQYKGKETASGAHSRLNATLNEGQRIRRRYTVWTGSLVNKGEEVYQVNIRSSSLPHLPLKLPDKLDINMGIHLDQVKRKIPPVLLSWEAYSGSREVLRCGMHCSLYEVVPKSKQESSLFGLLQRLERERIVLVKPLVDKGFLFLLSSSQLFTNPDRRGRKDRVLQALFVFQEQRTISKLTSKNSGVNEDPLVSLEPKDPIINQLDSFVPALHYGFLKLRANPPKELAVGLKRQALEYIDQKDQGALRPFQVAEYRHTLDDRTSTHPALRPKNMDVTLKSYLFSPGEYQLPLQMLQQAVKDSQQSEASPPAGAEEYSPVSDWGGSDRGPSSSSTPGVSHSNGGAQKQQSEYEKAKMEKLLKLIQMHKRTLVKDEGSGAEREEEWDPAGLKRKLEREGPGSVSKYLRAVAMDSLRVYDTDLREHATHSPTLRDTHTLLKLFLSTLSRMNQSSETSCSQPAELTKTAERQDSLTHRDFDLRARHADEKQEFLEGVEPCMSGVKKPAQSRTKTLDSIVDMEFQNLCSGIQKVMEAQHVIYRRQPPFPRFGDQTKRTNLAFSPFVSRYVSAKPLQGYVDSLCKKMRHLTRAACTGSLEPEIVAVAPVPAPLPPAPPPLVVQAPPPSSNAHPHKTTSPVPNSTKSTTKSQASIKPASSSKHRHVTVQNVHGSSAGKAVNEEAPETSPSAGIASNAPAPSVSDMSSESVLFPRALGERVLQQIEPDVLSTLMEIMQKNAVKFYIQPGLEENELCTDIKTYLRSLGNVDCNPLNYLEMNCQQKFMIIIQNEDIAAHVHKIPALVSLKKLPTVYFAGVDSVEDVKNRTYNELFVSGGIVVSDELILNPDNMTLEKLQAFFKLLEEQGSPWKWKIHCKTQKRLKELSRLNTEALDLLNLLTVYQKKHIVEFLPYHECDIPSRQAPDLDCLIKLQAQHTQLRHIVFLTERSDDAFSQFSGCGVIIAGMDEIMSNFKSLISISEREEVAALPELPEVSDAVRDEEDMSIDSEDDTTATDMNPQHKNNEMETQTPEPPPPQYDGFRPPLPDPGSVDSTIDPLSQTNPSSYPNQGPNLTDYAELKSAITLYKATVQKDPSKVEIEDSLTTFGVNPHQSYLCPISTQWSPYSGSPAYHMSSAYSSPVQITSRGSEYSQSGAPVNHPSINSSAVPTIQPLTIPPSLPKPPVPLENVQPPPEPAFAHLPPSLVSDDLGSQVVPTAATAVQLQPISSQPTETDEETASSSSNFPSYPDAAHFHLLTPIPPVPPVFNWGSTPGNHSLTSGQSVAGMATPSTTQTEASEPSASSWVEATESSTAAGPKQENPLTSLGISKVPQKEGGGDKVGVFASSNSFNQGGRIPANISAGRPPLISRGGGVSRGLLPIPPPLMGPMCRGGQNNSMYNPRLGPPDMMRGGFRGRGFPPHPLRSRAGRGQMRGGPSCNWGFPPGRGGGFRPDYSYN